MKKDAYVFAIAGFLLSAMFVLAILSVRNDSFTFDETSHVASGYSYLTQRDYRMNPEHPPLIKDLAALPLLFLNLNFPKDNPEWTQAVPAEWWDQFNFATQFLYYSGNDPDKILLWSRIPMILILVLLGWLIFMWAKELWGKKAALIALFLFAFSPTFLAHGRLVTTDVGAALGTVLASYFWLKLLKNTNKKSLILAGLAFGTALLIKFSLILLLPFFALITLVYAWINNGGENKCLFVLKKAGFSVLAGLIGVVFVIWPVYEYHVSDYPKPRQIEDTKTLLATTRIPKVLKDINIFMSSNAATRPLGQYFLGLLTAGNRTTSGNTTYFMGQVSADSWKSYFPVVYFIKNPLPFHILTAMAILYALWLAYKNILRKKRGAGLGAKAPYRNEVFGIRSHFTEFSMISFLGIYWIVSLFSNLNIGVRHLMPVFPFTIMLVGGMTAHLLKKPFLKLKYAVLGTLIMWQTISIISAYPHFLAYFNESIGGPQKGYLYAVDSNLDWGQDLRRLRDWAEENNIEKIYLDYFGGGNADYYLKEKYAPWWGARNPNELPRGNYLAVSATLLQGGRANPVKGFDQPSDYYRWLDAYEPVAKIGYSIFVYRIDD